MKKFIYVFAAICGFVVASCTGNKQGACCDEACDSVVVETVDTLAADTLVSDSVVVDTIEVVAE